MRVFAIVLLFSVIGYSCKKKKNNNTTVTPTTTQANIDSLVGFYYGTTSGDSLYSYTDTAGVLHQTVHSFSWTDSVFVVANDTTTVTVASKFYTVTFPYTNGLTVGSITNLFCQFANYGNYGTYTVNLTDTTNTANHLVVRSAYGYSKNYITDVLLYKR